MKAILRKCAPSIAAFVTIFAIDHIWPGDARDLRVIVIVSVFFGAAAFAWEFWEKGASA